MLLWCFKVHIAVSIYSACCLTIKTNKRFSICDASQKHSRSKWNDNICILCPYAPHLPQSSLEDYLNWVDFINFAFSEFHVQYLYTSFCNYNSASFSNKFISWHQYTNPSDKIHMNKRKKKRFSKYTYRLDDLLCD